jgi:hypothetical protein
MLLSLRPASEGLRFSPPLKPLGDFGQQTDGISEAPLSTSRHSASSYAGPNACLGLSLYGVALDAGFSMIAEADSLHNVSSDRWRRHEERKTRAVAAVRASETGRSGDVLLRWSKIESHSDEVDGRMRGLAGLALAADKPKVRTDSPVEPLKRNQFRRGHRQDDIHCIDAIGIKCVCISHSILPSSCSVSTKATSRGFWVTACLHFGPPPISL